MKARIAAETFAQTSKIVLPNDTNVLTNLMGGQLLSWMDITAGISAQRHSRRVVVTASVNNVSFNQPIRLGDVVTIEAKISRAFTSSMEVYLDVYIDLPNGTKKKSNEAIYTFVAVDQNGSPIEVPELIAETDLEKERYAGALRRRQLSLILAGKMKPEAATELKALFG
ncbi:acyl-CoA thioesterase [bacterium]|nr:acyl-CoA thioesterase [Vicingaceae bacterium]MDC0004908.1 acyl-CoA thioesterase [bacterium]